MICRLFWWAVALMIPMALGGCRRSNPRPLPDGFPRRYFKQLTAIAEKAALRCDELLALPDCYNHNGSHEGGPSGDPTKVVPLPARPLGGTAQLRLLHARCLKNDAPIVYCDSGPLDFPSIPESCGKLTIMKGWSPLPNSWSPSPVFDDAEELEVFPQAQCPERWVEVTIMRHSPKGHELNLLAMFKL
jgi:hypothetical protein